MSTGDALEFLKRIQADEALRERLDAIEAKHREAEAAEIVALGAEAGLEFTPEEMRSVAMQIALSDDQLDDVVGGAASAAPPRLSRLIRGGSRS